MSQCLPLTPHPSPLTPPAAGNRRGYIDLPTAAKRSGRSVGHLQRQCMDKWAGEGLAEQRRPPQGGKPRWYVLETADPSFAAVKFPEAMGTDLRRVPARKREQAIDRRRILDQWHKARAAGLQLGRFTEAQITGHFLQRLEIDEGTKLSRGTLYNWERSWRRGGLSALVDGRGNEPAGAPTDDPFLTRVKDLYLSPRKRKLTVCHLLAAEAARDKGWEHRSYKACQRFIDALPVELVKKLREGEEAYTNDAEPYLERDYTTLRSNEIWCGDHHQFDVLVKVRQATDSASGEITTRHVRPWITAWEDMRSRKITGYSIFATDPNTDTILAAFRMGVLDCGVPEGVYIDNGKDYDSYALNGRTKKDRWSRRRVKVQFDPDRFAGIFGALGVSATHAQAYHGQSKPIERFFGTVESRFTRNFDTYCGNSPAEKPQDLQLNLERGKAPTLEDFQESFAGWLASDYHARGHGGDGMDGRTPDAVFAAELTSKRTAPAELLDVLLLKRIGPVIVGQNGVTYSGLRYGQYEPALHERLGGKVYLRVDDRDLSAVQVWTEDDRLVCMAPANARIPANADAGTLRAALRTKGQIRKSVQEYRQVRPHVAEDLPDLMTRAAASAAKARKAPEPPDAPPSLKPVRSPLEAQLPTLRRMVEGRQHRKAVGAESLTPDEGRFLYRAPAAGPSGDDGEDASPSFRQLMLSRQNSTEEEP
jgi:putative transposase